MDLSGAADAYLIGLIVNGEPDAVRPLIERYQKALASLLQRALGTSDVDDLCQETWIRVVRKAHQYDPTYRFSSWLFGIAWNELRDEWARRKTTETLDAETQVHPADRQYLLRFKMQRAFRRAFDAVRTAGTNR